MGGGGGGGNKVGSGGTAPTGRELEKHVIALRDVFPQKKPGEIRIALMAVDGDRTRAVELLMQKKD